MFSKNLKYYRLKRNFSKKELASLCDVSPMAITHYENGDRKPSMETIKALAKVLGVRVTDFLVVKDQGLTFEHAEFRKNRRLTVSQQEYVKESVEEYFNRFFTVVEILGGEVLPSYPVCHKLVCSEDDEENALRLREYLDFPRTGAIGNLIEALENIGILVFACAIENEHFSGMNGFVNGRPYIVYNDAMSDERNRSTLVHELAHLMFHWPEELSKEEELRATSIAGAFLFPAGDAKRELGLRRRHVSQDMELVCKEYGISMMLLVKRAEICGILSSQAAKEFYISAGAAGWRKKEPSRIVSPEVPTLFRQLVYRAVSEEEISVQKGAELLRVSYETVEENCRFGGEYNAIYKQ